MPHPAEFINKPPVLPQDAVVQSPISQVQLKPLVSVFRGLPSSFRWLALSSSKDGALGVKSHLQQGKWQYMLRIGLLVLLSPTTSKALAGENSPYKPSTHPPLEDLPKGEPTAMVLRTCSGLALLSSAPSAERPRRSPPTALARRGAQKIARGRRAFHFQKAFSTSLARSTLET